MSETLVELKERIVIHVLSTMSEHPNQDEIRQFIDIEEDNLIGYHHSLGRDIRNEFLLWNHPAIIQTGEHPDTFSMACIREIHARAVAQFRRKLFSLK